MLFDTRLTRDTECPHNPKIGYDGKTTNIAITVDLAKIANLHVGDYVCVRHRADKIVIFKSVTQKPGIGRSVLQLNERANGVGYLMVSTSQLEFRVDSFARCGVRAVIEKLGEIQCDMPSKDNMMLPKSARGERKVKFTYEESRDFFLSMTAEEIDELRQNDSEVYDAAVRGLAR